MMPPQRSGSLGLWLAVVFGTEASACSATELSVCPTTGGMAMLQHASHTDRTGVANLAAEGAGEVLYVIRISSKTQSERLQPILDTWASGLPQESLLVVGDVASEIPKVYGATECPDNHEQGLSCKTGHALALAAGMLGSRQWVFVLDDDHYVNTTNLEGVLAKKDASKLQAFGIPGCGPTLCDDHEGGFCGGGGYAVSRAALQALVRKHEPEKLSGEFIKAAEETFRGQKHMFSDVTCSCLMKRRGVVMERLQGLYGWRLDDFALPNNGVYEPRDLDPRLRHAIHSVDPLPLVFHYLYPQEMYKIHEEFASSGPGVSLLAMSATPAGHSYEEQLQKFIAEENKKFLP